MWRDENKETISGSWKKYCEGKKLTKIDKKKYYKAKAEINNNDYLLLVSYPPSPYHERFKTKSENSKKALDEII